MARPRPPRRPTWKTIRSAGRDHPWHRPSPPDGSHAAARAACVRLPYGRDRLTITVTDDGTAPASPPPKDVTAEGLLAGMRTVATGDSLLSPLATRVPITRFLSSPAQSARLATPADLASLTAREREVMAWVAEGHSKSRAPVTGPNWS